MIDENLYAQAQNELAREQQKCKEAELEEIKTTLVQKLKNGELPAFAKTTPYIINLLTEENQMPERQHLLACLAVYGVPENKVRVYVLSVTDSMVIIDP